jgi:cell division protein FtsB
VENEELNSLLTTIQNQEKTIEKLEAENKSLRARKAKADK